MGTNIQPWDLDYWLDIYKQTGLEMYYHTFGKMHEVNQQKINDYCTELAYKKKWSNDVKIAAVKKLTDIMKLFNENHKYLAYGVFILRKSPQKEYTLF